MPRLLKKSWLDSFLEYTDESTAPLEWLRWAGISAISTSLKRNSYIWWHRIQLYPNQYIILIGPPGIGKGDAVGFAIDITRAAGTVNYLSDWNTPQEMIDELATGYNKPVLSVSSTGVTTGLISVDRSACILGKELAVVLQSYDNLHTILCRWWDDGEFDYKTKNKGKFLIRELCVSMLAGCVPRYIKHLLKDTQAVVTSGFTARCIFILEKEKRKQIEFDFGKVSNTNQQLRDDLVHDLKEIGNINGEFCFDIGAEGFWRQKFQERQKRYSGRGNNSSDVSQDFESRVEAHIIKTAIAICASDADTRTITRDHLERATEYVERVENKIDTIFRGVGESPLAPGEGYVLDFIESSKYTTLNDVIRACKRHVTVSQINDIIAQLQYSGDVIYDLNGTGKQVIKYIGKSHP